MFDLSKEQVEKEVRERRDNRKAAGAIMDMISEIMLNSDMPETKKQQIRVMNATREFETFIHDTATNYAMSDNPDVEVGKKLCFLYITVTEQIKALIASTEGENA